jgi:hypothetical protein
MHRRWGRRLRRRHSDDREATPAVDVCETGGERETEGLWLTCNVIVTAGGAVAK